ncbi:unnamed protein product, partial [Didymodactylos carnosus]
MVLNFLKKNDYWTQVGGTEGFLAAVKQLGSDYRELDVEGSNGYTKSDGIWGRLAERTQNPKKNTYETRKWLYTTCGRGHCKGEKCPVKVTVEAEDEPKNKASPCLFKRNLRYANEDPLKEGNFTEVPSIDVLKTAKQRYNKKYRLDEDYFQELRMSGFFTRCTDDESEDIK